MASIRLKKLVLRCYGHKSKDKWFGVCIDLNLAVEADSLESLRGKMNEVIGTFIEAVLDTKDKNSIPELISRRAPIRDRLIYHSINLIFFIKNLRNNLVFKEFIPFHLAHNC